MRALLAPLDRISECVFFFFQAEDGIRDRNVTGVQTCALPILSTSQDSTATGRAMARSMSTAWSRMEVWARPYRIHTRAPARSEERRVGKECRSRWSREQ